MLNYRNDVFVVDTAYRYHSKPFIGKVTRETLQKGGLVFRLTDGSSRIYRDHGSVQVYPM
jgi:hypothetical protein